VLVANQIEYEIVPGVTAALGAAAYAGIPLTARDYSTAVRFLTYYKMDVIKDEVWKDLAATDDTLVFYMSSDTTDLLIQKLIESKIGNDKHIAVIEQATTPLQNVYECNVYDYAEKFGKSSYVSPTLLIIGKVAALHQQFKWTENSNNKENYFEPVAKRKDALSRA
jgi:siroheme synthase